VAIVGGKEKGMFTFETTDPKEMRRYRIAQFNGKIAAIRSGGSTITGHVRSVQECQSVPPRWTITLVRREPKIKVRALRPAPRVRAFAEDFD
jgi:hypothetical protein